MLGPAALRLGLLGTMTSLLCLKVYKYKWPDSVDVFEMEFAADLDIEMSTMRYSYEYVANKHVCA